MEESKERLLKAIEIAREKILTRPSEEWIYKSWFDCIRGLLDTHKEIELAIELNYELRNIVLANAKNGSVRKVFCADFVKRTYLFAAPYRFDDFCIYLEWNREQEKRFYLPRRKQLLPITSALQELADDKIDLLAISLPPGVGKSTLAIFYLCWIAGREPNKPTLGGSHSNSFLRGVYDECLRIITSTDEYLWSDVFPNIKVASTNAKDMRIDLDTPSRFETLEFSSVGSGNAGKVRAGALLYCDDLCSGIEEAISKVRLDTLWQLYTTDLRQRKIGNCKELHIATRWSVHDVIGRLESLYGGNGRSKFITVPALDENDESNFNYPYGVGFTTAFYHEQREVMDDASWRALYMNQPIEREGQLYNPDELRRFFELPSEEPDSILAVCDTKDKGIDYCVLPVAYQYGQDFYIEDVVCENFQPEIVEQNLINMLLKHKVKMARFESNSAGGRVAEKVRESVKSRGGHTNITTKYTTQNKETKILVNAPYVKEHFLFKDESVLKGNKEYRLMLQMLCGWTMAGKNKHDDVPDAMSQLAEYIQSLEGTVVGIIKRPF